jgi:hypothetical protein
MFHQVKGSQSFLFSFVFIEDRQVRVTYVLKS